MNKTYRVVWNAEIGHWVVASEVAKGQKKTASTRSALCLAVLTVTGVSGSALAGNYSAGGGSTLAGNNQIAIGQATAWDNGCYVIGGGGTFAGNSYCAGADSVSFGSGAQTNKQSDVAIGASAKANGGGAIALGGAAMASGQHSISIGGTETGKPGDWTVASGKNAIALGYYAYANQENSVALGASSVTDRTNAVSVGSSSLKRQITNVAWGTSGTDAVNVDQLNAKFAAVPPDPNAVHYDAGSAQGKVTLAGAGGTTVANVKDGSTATGSKEAVNGGQLGLTNQNVTNLTNNFSTLNTTVEGLRDNALLWDGTSAYTAKHAGANAKIRNLAAGDVNDTSTEAINGSQLFGTAKSVADALGGGSAVGADGKVSTPTYKVNNESKQGVQAAIEALDARFGTISSSDSPKWDANAAGGAAYSASHGDPATASRITNVANATQASDAVNKGQMDEAIRPFTEIAPKLKYIKFGATNASDAFANGTDALAIGGNAFATGDKALAIGANANAVANSVAIGPGSITTEANTFAVGGTLAKQHRRIVNVADGIVDTDAATVGQVKEMISQKFGPAMHSASLLKSAGAVNVAQVATSSEPMAASTASTLASTSTAISTSTSAAGTHPSMLGAPSASVVAAAAAATVEQAAAGAPIEVGKTLDGTAVGFRGTAGDRTLTGVAAGKANDEAVNAGQLKAAGVMNAQGEVNGVLSYDSASRASVTLGGPGAAPVAMRNVAAGSADTDAVNVSQLNQRLGETRTSAIREANAYTDQRLSDIWTGLDQIANKLSAQDRRISDVGAMSTAHAQMVSNAAAASLRGDNGAWAVGLGHQESRSAISVGYAKSIGEKSQVSFGASFSDDDQSIGLGFGRAL